MDYQYAVCVANISTTSTLRTKMDLETQKQALIELLLLGAEQIRLEKYRDMEQVFEDFEHEE